VFKQGIARPGLILNLESEFHRGRGQQGRGPGHNKGAMGSLLEKNPSSNPSVILRFPIRKDAVKLELALQLGHLPILQQSSL
jgi:hypothetical protein